MTYVMFFLDSQLSTRVCNAPQGECLEFHDRIYTRVSPTESRVPFYDWVLDSENNPTAFSLHYSKAEILDSYGVVFPQRNYIDLLPFPCIWLGASRCGSEAGLEAWGGLEFYTNESGGLMISVAAINELDDKQIQQLLMTGVVKAL